MTKLIFSLFLCFEIRVSLSTLGWLSTHSIVLADLELKAFPCLSARIVGVSDHIYHLLPPCWGLYFQQVTFEEVTMALTDSMRNYANRDVLEVSFIL